MTEQENYIRRAERLKFMLDQSKIKYTFLGYDNPIVFVIKPEDEDTDDDRFKDFKDITLIFAVNESTYTYYFDSIYNTNGKSSKFFLRFAKLQMRMKEIGEIYFIDEYGYVSMCYSNDFKSVDTAYKMLLILKKNLFNKKALSVVFYNE